MFSEAIDSYYRTLDVYSENCRDAANARSLGILRQSASQMRGFDASCDKALQALAQGAERRRALSRQLDGILKKIGSFALPDDIQGTERAGGGNGRPESTAFQEQRARQGNIRSSQTQHASGQNIVSNGKPQSQGNIMDEKAKDATQEFLASFHSVQAIEKELRETEEALSEVKETRSNIRSLIDTNGQFERMRVVGAAELQKLESKLQTATKVRDKAKGIEADLHNPELFYFVSGDYFVAKTVCESVQPDLEEFNQFWKGSSDKVKELLKRVIAILKDIRNLDSRNSRLSKEHTALSREAKEFLQQCGSEVENISSLLSQAKSSRNERDKTLEKIRQYVMNIANALSKLSGKSASQFISTRDAGEGRSLSLLNQAVNPQTVFSAALATHRQALADLCAKCRIRQPKLEKLGKNDMNLTTVYPKHIICAETTTDALGNGKLAIPYSVRFPFEKPVTFGNESDIAPFLIRLLYTLPMGKLQIYAIDHKSAGENIGPLNALCKLNGQLRIVTSTDEISPLLRDLVGLMGEMRRNVMTYRENNWATYNANHPEATLPLRIITVYSMYGFRSDHLDMLQQLLENGPTFGIICVLADVASDDLDERLHGRFEEMDCDPIRIEEDGTKLEDYENLSLEMSSESISNQRIGELAEIYAEECKNLSSRPTREINFLSLFEGVDMWKEKTTEGISTTIGWDVAGNPVNFEFGIGRGAAAYHALIGGMTGSGKSVFLHTLIQSLAGRYSPEELQLYLLDYKKGDEFKKYADARGNAWLPHVKMISRHKDPRFALELFDFLDKEFTRRSDQFGNYGDIVSYRKNGGQIPRIIVIIDEFQVMFEEYCGLNLSDEVAKRLSTIFKQGRSYGIHLVLATQSLKSLHVSGWGDMANQIGLRIALKGTGEDGILESGNRMAETIKPKSQCIVNHELGRKDSDGVINNIVTVVPWSDPAQVKDCKKLQMLIERKAKELHITSSCRVFNGAELPELPGSEEFAASLESVKKWNTFFTLLLGARTDFASTPFAVNFMVEQREHLLVAGEDGKLISDSDVRITGEDVWNGIRRDILLSLRKLPSSKILYYNPAVGAIPEDVPGQFLSLCGWAKEKDLLEAFHELESSKAERKIVMVENFQDARLLHPADAPRTSFSSRPAEPQPETSRSIFASLFNGTDDPKFHVIIMTKNFGFMNKEVLARSGAETNILKGCHKRVAFNLSDDDLTAMIPHQKTTDRRGPRRVWFEDMRTGSVTDFLPYGK